MDTNLSETKQSKSGGEEAELSQWFGSSVETHSDPLIDKQTGEKVIFRFFQFQANPELLRLHKPTKQELFDNHRKQIELMLWGDGLEVYPVVDPQIVISKKEDKYAISIAAKARKEVSIMDNPQNLQKIWTNS